MSKKYEGLEAIDKKVLEVFNSRSKIDFTLWVRQQMKPLDTAAVLHDALSLAVQNNSTPRRDTANIMYPAVETVAVSQDINVDVKANEASDQAIDSMAKEDSETIKREVKKPRKKSKK